MNPVPQVLGLPAELARERLGQAGFVDVEVLASGRRREGGPRVIRQRSVGGKVELIVSYFKEIPE